MTPLILTTLSMCSQRPRNMHLICYEQFTNSYPSLLSIILTMNINRFRIIAIVMLRYLATYHLHHIANGSLDFKVTTINVTTIDCTLHDHWNNIDINTLHGTNVQYEQLIRRDFNNCHHFIFTRRTLLLPTFRIETWLIKTSGVLEGCTSLSLQVRHQFQWVNAFSNVLGNWTRPTFRHHKYSSHYISISSSLWITQSIKHFNQSLTETLIPLNTCQ